MPHPSHCITTLLAASLLASAAPSAAAVQPTVQQTPTALAAPVLKWRYGGCGPAPFYCQTGWYASAAVADVDNDGRAEVLWGGYDLFALNGEDGSVQWRAPNNQRIWPGIAVADVDADGALDIAVGRGGDQLTLYRPDGSVKWTVKPFGAGEVRTLALADLERDGQLELIVGRGSLGATKQVNVFNANGSARAGWPARRDGEPGFGWGMYNQNVAIADLDNNGASEIYAPTDTHYITALQPNGDQLDVSSIYGPRRFWSQVGVHVDQAADLRGFANCGTEHRPNFANAAPASADMDGDGSLELVVTGNVYNCQTDPYTDLYNIPFILERDRTRWSGSGFDWTNIPVPAPNSAPRSQDFNVIENAAINTVLADLDGDGKREILYPSYDGRLHAYWLDKTQRGSWPWAVPGIGLRFASEPAVADLDNDGKAEVIVASWPEKRDGRVGQLHILSATGQQLYAVDLPPPGEGATWNGALGAPTLANIDNDPDLEVVLGTSHSGVVAYDLPGSAGARMLWGTGRGSYLRNGQAPQVVAGFTLSSAQPVQQINAGASAVFTLSVAGVSGPVELSISAPQGPAPLPTVQLSTNTLNGTGQFTATLTDQRPAGPLVPGATYRVTVTARANGVDRTQTLYLFVGGSRVVAPLVRR